MTLTDFLTQLQDITPSDKKKIEKFFNKEVKRQAFILLNAGDIWDQDHLPLNHARLILLTVALNLKVSVEDISGKCRKRPFTDARKIYSYIIKNVSEHRIVLEDAGRLINKSHSGVINQCREAEILQRVNKDFAIKLNKCVNAYKQRKSITA